MSISDTPCRFLIFSGSDLYPAGGWFDYYSSSDTLEGAIYKAKELKREWWHVVDTNAAEIVARGMYDRQDP